MTLIMFTRHFSHLFANPQWIELNQTSIDLKLLSRCYHVMSRSPLPTLFLALLRQTDYVNIRKVEDMQDVYQDSFLLSNVWTV